MKAHEQAELALRIQLKRVYEASSGADGARFLVERLWPRGIKKSSLEIQAWLKDVALKEFLDKRLRQKTKSELAPAPTQP